MQQAGCLVRVPQLDARRPDQAHPRRVPGRPARQPGAAGVGARAAGATARLPARTARAARPRRGRRRPATATPSPFPRGRRRSGPTRCPRVGLYRGNGVRALRLKAARPYLAAAHRPGVPGAERRAATAPWRVLAAVTPGGAGSGLRGRLHALGVDHAAADPGQPPPDRDPVRDRLHGGAAGRHRIPDWKFGEGWYERLGGPRPRWTSGCGSSTTACSAATPRSRASRAGARRRPSTPSTWRRWRRSSPTPAFVGIVRHPGAVASSLHRRFHYGFAEAVDLLVGHQPGRCSGAGIALGDRFGLCRYEDLVQRGEPVLRELLDFLDEPWAPEVIEHHRVQREKGAPRAAEGSTITSDPVDASRADAWATTVTAGDRSELDRVAGLAAFLGYDATPPGAADPREPGEHRSPVVTGTELAARRRPGRSTSAAEARRLGLAELGSRSWRHGWPAPRLPWPAPGPGVRCASATPYARCSTAGRSRPAGRLAAAARRDRRAVRRGRGRAGDRRAGGARRSDLVPRTPAGPGGAPPDTRCRSPLAPLRRVARRSRRPPLLVAKVRHRTPPSAGPRGTPLRPTLTATRPTRRS